MAKAQNPPQAHADEIQSTPRYNESPELVLSASDAAVFVNRVRYDLDFKPSDFVIEAICEELAR